MPLKKLISKKKRQLKKQVKKELFSALGMKPVKIKNPLKPKRRRKPSLKRTIKKLF